MELGEKALVGARERSQLGLHAVEALIDSALLLGSRHVARHNLAEHAGPVVPAHQLLDDYPLPWLAGLAHGAARAGASVCACRPRLAPMAGRPPRPMHGVGPMAPLVLELLQPRVEPLRLRRQVLHALVLAPHLALDALLALARVVAQLVDALLQQVQLL